MKVRVHRSLEAEVAASHMGERHEPFPVGPSEIARVIAGEGWPVQNDQDFLQGREGLRCHTWSGQAQSSRECADGTLRPASTWTN